MEQDKEKKNEIPPQIESMDNMPFKPQAEPISQNVVEDKFIPVEEHVETPFVDTESRDNSIEPVNESTPPIPLVPVLGEMNDNMYSMENNTRKKRKMRKNNTKGKRRCKKGSCRNKRTHHCRKNKKRV
jgi:hypothetical protein